MQSILPLDGDRVCIFARTPARAAIQLRSSRGDRFALADRYPFKGSRLTQGHEAGKAESPAPV